MALYAIGDTHLSLGSQKPMDIFGDKWENHAEKLKKGFARLEADDVCVICGDISWGMGIEECREDFLFIHSLPGKKIILKGNHDYWWSTAAKARRFFDENGIDSIEILYNNCFDYKGFAICGTRGWFYEEEKGGEHDKKIMRREIMRLEASLKAAGDKPKLAFISPLQLPRDTGATQGAQCTALLLRTHPWTGLLRRFQGLERGHGIQAGLR